MAEQLVVPGVDLSTVVVDDNPLEFYRTPAWVIRTLFRRMPAPTIVCDPFAGDGAILDAARDFFGPQVKTVGIELDPERAAICVSKGHKVVEADAFKHEWPTADAYVTNPPHSRSMEALAIATQRVQVTEKAQGNRVSMLLRSAIMETKERNAFFVANPPFQEILVPRRIPFTGKETDKWCCSWFVWDDGVADSTLRTLLPYDECSEDFKETV